MHSCYIVSKKILCLELTEQGITTNLAIVYYSAVTKPFGLLHARRSCGFTVWTVAEVQEHRLLVASEEWRLFHLLSSNSTLIFDFVCAHFSLRWKLAYIYYRL